MAGIQPVRTRYALEHAKYAIPLLPPDVFLNGEEAALSAREVIKGVAIGIFRVGGFGELIKRTYLMDRYEFRRWAANEPRLSPTVKKIYREAILPRRLWVTELNLTDDYHLAGTDTTGPFRRLGEVVCDASSDPEEHGFLLFHVNTKLIDNDRTGVLLCGDPFDPSKKAEPMRILDENPYGPYCRMPN